MRFHGSLLSSVGLAAFCATPALAQTAPAVPVETTPQKTNEQQTVPAAPTNAEGQPATKRGEEAIVITGSRIRHSTFTTPSPVNIITRDDRILAGSRSTGEVLQSASITSGTAQVNGAYLGFVSEGGPAASTVGLRGLDASRTLVLLNGRRLAPAGVGPQLIAADLNTLPTSAIQRIEVLREGASSIYGSDAIAGVINVITDSSINGVTIDGFANHPLYGVGDSLRGSITAGKTFSRGHIMAAFEYRDQQGVRLGDRADFSCPRDLFFKNGTEVGQIDPATGGVTCFPFVFNTGSGIASGYGIGGVIAPFYSPGVFNVGRFTYTNPAGPFRVVNGLTRTSPSPTQLQTHVISPVRTYTGYANGSYELGVLGDAELYGEALFTRRQSHQDWTNQLSIQTNQLSPNIQIFGGTYYGAPLSNYGSYPLSPFFPNNLASAGINRFTPFIIPDRESHTKQTVNYLRANGGLRGSLPFGDWRYDANLQYSRTRATYSVTGTDIRNLNNALETVLAPAGTPGSVITVALPGQAGAGNSYTCASNVTNGAYNGGSCVPLNLYDPNILVGGHIPDNVYNYLFQDQTGHSHYDQTTFEFNTDGTIAQLPGGPLKGAAGFVHRIDKVDDIPSPVSQARLLYNYSSSGETRGKDTVDEVYGELDAPFLRDRPFAKLLEVDLSGRWTHYRVVGSKFTYHLNAQWAPVSGIRFRGNYGTNFRAPNLYELFVNGISGFYGGSVDPCSGFGSLSPNSTVYKNCLAQLTPILGANATSFIATAGPEVLTVGNASTLKPETARTYGFGVVLTAPRRIGDLTFAADYWHIKIANEISQFNNLILNRCYEATDFPNNAFCQLIAPRLPATDPQRGALSSFQNPFFNIAVQSVSGIDFDARYATRLFNGRFIGELQATRNLHMWYQGLSTDTPTDFVGTPGVQGLYAAGPKWVGTLDLRYTTPSDITFRWGVNYVGRQSANKLVDPFEAFLGFGIGLVSGDLTANSYITHGASVQWNWRNVGQFTIGVNNIFNRKPPTFGGWPTSDGQYARIGNYLNSSAYDYFGRSLFVNVTRTFK